MRVTITLKGNTWLIVPIEGKFAGKLVAVSDYVSMKDVIRYSRCIEGEILSVWGLQILEPHIDAPTLRRIVGHRRFNMDGARRVPMDYFDQAARLVVKGPLAYIGS